MIDLWKIKENFSTLVVDTEPWTLAQFVMWLDLKISEYKIKGFMILDHQNSTKPRWMSPDGDTDPDTDVAPQPPPCRKCEKGDNPTWEPYRISHLPPTKQSRQHKRQRFEMDNENFVTREQSQVSNRRDISDLNFNSNIQIENRPNTTVIDLENVPEPTMYITGDIAEQGVSQNNKPVKRNTGSAPTYPISSNSRSVHLRSPSHFTSSTTSSNSYFEKQRQRENISHSVSSPSNSSQSRDNSSHMRLQHSSQSSQVSNQTSTVDGSTQRSGGHENRAESQSEEVVPVYLHSNVNMNSENQNFDPGETTPAFVLTEVKQEDFESSIADISGFDEEMPPSGNDNSRTSYSDDEQNSNLDQNFPQDGSSGRSATDRQMVMSFAASNIELPVFEDPLVRRVLEDSSSTPSRHMWSKIISRCAYHMLSKGVPHKHDYQAFSEAFYYRYPCVGTSRGPHPWTVFARSVSQKVRTVRWRTKHAPNIPDIWADTSDRQGEDKM